MKRHPTSDTVSLTEGHIAKQIIRLATPIIGTSFIQIAYSFTDLAWVGRLGSESFSALGIVSVLTWLATCIGALVKSGSEVLVAQGLGNQNRTLARSFAQHAAMLSLILAALVMLLFGTLGAAFIGLYGLGENISTLAQSYLYRILWGFPAYYLTLAYSGTYNAVGRSYIPFVINSLGLLLNMVLDPLFIFGLGWGIEGAALATVVAQWSVGLIFLWQVHLHDRLLGGWHIIAPLKRFETGKMLRLGIPIVSLNSIFVFITVVVGILTARVGGHIGVGTINAGGQLEAITWNTSQGFGTALAAFVAQNYAARLPERIKRGFVFTITFTSLFGLIATLLYVVWGTELFALIEPESEVYLEGGHYLRIVGYFQLFMMAEIVVQGLFYGTARSLPPALISIVGNGLRIPLILLFLYWGWGLDSVWWAIAASMVVKGSSALLFIPYLMKKIRR